ncbi:hypothetical protein V6N12_025918 [Hibiscus sabdariffa]|uniref:Uncharacterized protein n=1 Tax=Hibiscus sabdariffa TaxID=183260 RepID=A0ABR2DQ78_9ROSI
MWKATLALGSGSIGTMKEMANMMAPSMGSDNSKLDSKTQLHSNKRVSVDKLSRFEELNSASISYLGVSTPGDPAEIRASVPNLKELDFTGNLISNWKVTLILFLTFYLLKF